MRTLTCILAAVLVTVVAAGCGVEIKTGDSDKASTTPAPAPTPTPAPTETFPTGPTGGATTVPTVPTGPNGPTSGGAPAEPAPTPQAAAAGTQACLQKAASIADPSVRSTVEGGCRESTQQLCEQLVSGVVQDESDRKAGLAACAEKD